jgi:hypothetical protein
MHCIKKINVSSYQYIIFVYYILYFYTYVLRDRFCSLVVRVLGYRSGGPGLIPGTTRKKSSGSGTGSTQAPEYN